MFDVKEKPQLVEKALLIAVQLPEDDPDEVENLLVELSELVRTLGIRVVATEAVKIREPKPRFLMGEGRADEVIQKARDLACDAIVFDNELGPSQGRNWEAASGLCVVDRQEVILDIFSERAQTREAVLQVELARMEYNLPRLKRAWTHLSRQRGGGVTQRGEGESQLELDQRMVRTRIAKLKRELTEVVRQRGEQRKTRMKKPVPSAAIVGYTNAGKSSLLNALTRATVLAEDKLFATLDPTTRRLELDNGLVLLLTDTVGFVRRLPHRLVEAFKATLEEALVADFLIHVVDISSPDHEAFMRTTMEVLGELGADRKRIVTVYNKIDLLDDVSRERTRERADATTAAVSVHTGEGIPDLRDKLAGMLEGERTPLAVLIPHEQYAMVALFHRAGVVTSERAEPEGTYLTGSLPPKAVARFAPFRVDLGDAKERQLHGS